MSDRRKLDGHRKYRYHPACAKMAACSQVEFADLCADLRSNGQTYPILVFDEQIIDGRRRYEACRQTKITPWIEEVSREELRGIDDLSSPAEIEQAIHRLVLGLEWNRRKSSRSDLARIAAEWIAEGRLATAPLSMGQVPQEQPREETSPAGPPANHRANHNQSTPTVSTTAQQTGASERSTERALYLSESPNVTQELRALWKAGKVKVGPAEKIGRQPGSVQRFACQKILDGVEAPEALRQAQAHEKESAKLPVNDQVGVRVPSHLSEVFEDRDEFYRLSGQLGGAAKRLRDIADRRSSRHLKNPSESADRLDALAEQLRAVAPYALCPYCAGKVGQCDTAKSACHGAGWLIKSEYENLPKERQKAG